jgi:hypothetical protein
MTMFMLYEGTVYALYEGSGCAIGCDICVGVYSTRGHADEARDVRLRQAEWAELTIVPFVMNTHPATADDVSKRIRKIREKEDK